MPVSLNNTYMVNKDGQMLTEAYLSALQKGVNIPHTFKPKQPDDVQDAETYEDRLQGITTSNKEPEEPQSFNDVVTAIIAPVTTSLEPEHNCSCSKESESSQMVKTNLYTIYKSAKQIYDIVRTGHELDYWMNEKLAVCAENISNVLKVAEYDYADQNYSANDESISTKPSL